MKLSAHFELAELVHSQTAARCGIDNSPPAAVLTELVRLATLVLQPLREAIGRPIVISSGYRSPKLNAAVGGAKESAHMLGQAADLVVPGMAPLQVCRVIVSMGLPFDQLIHEFGEWSHVAVTPAGVGPRRQVLTARRDARGRTVYTEGI